MRLEEILFELKVELIEIIEDMMEYYKYTAVRGMLAIQYEKIPYIKTLDEYKGIQRRLLQINERYGG